MTDSVQQAAADYKRRQQEAIDALPAEERERRLSEAARRQHQEDLARQVNSGLERLNKVANSFATETAGTLPKLMVVGSGGSDTSKSITWALEAPSGGFSGSETLQIAWNPAGEVTAYMGPKVPIPAGQPIPSPTVLGSVVPTAASEDWIQSMFVAWVRQRTPEG